MVPDFQMPCHQSSHHTAHHYSNTMPRTSAKQAALARSIKRRNILLLLSHRDAAFNDTCLQESQYFPLFAKQASAVQKLRKSRYSTREMYRTRDHSQAVFAKDLHERTQEEEQAEQEEQEEETSVASHTPWLTHNEFLQKYRMSRKCFGILLNLIQDDEVFSSKIRGRKQAPVAHQLMVFLKALGSEGNAFSNPNLREVFFTGRGTNALYIKRVTKAVTNMKDQYLKWPNEDERKIIKQQIQSISQLPNCVGLIDGTLFPLAFMPSTPDAPDYKGRKHGYSISYIIVCDHNRLITYAYGGWPGCTHDNRVFRNSTLYTSPLNFFGPSEYLLGDSAFECTPFMVSAYTHPSGSQMDVHEARFNSCLSKARVLSEHTIGLLKGRFPWLRSIRKKVSHRSKDLRDILRLIEASIILHNFLVKQGDNDSDAWEEEDGDVSDADDPSRLPVEDELNQPLPPGADHRTRRQQLNTYVQDNVI